MIKFKQVKLLHTIILFGVITLLFTSCYPDYGLSTSDFDIVATFKDDGANFQNYRTYYMPDTIKTVSDGNVVPNNGSNDAAYLQEIANQMQAYGYERVNSLAQSDVELVVGVTSSTTWVYDPGYWWGYYGWYYPWYGGGYAYSYSTGTLMLFMRDNEKFDPNNEVLGLVWSGSANGILDDTKANIKARAISSIDQMFEQSPYLKIIQ